ncbi:hypothetical protein Acsp03_55680 [Actinomadura sp. NBRC 104412]|uniref:DUF2255 family protein n=1 Tax=Actinomadura sp. NBRC 104412 TaxID=3032203 RepID=UPI0024A2F550|nr:DUF2255 family protein [Actinomadura sp. NBRC 104412]GLZ08102.1 hypothetical protein Acsp03_55680 [Actinomadura sp. NBRC 104412]
MATTTTWTSEELDKIGGADELQVAPMSDGGPRRPTTIWVVRNGDDLYIRSYRGPEGVWYRAAKATRRGHIRAGGVDKDVVFTEESDGDLMDSIDRAYRSKYGKYPRQYVDPMVAPEARACTMKLVPRSSA